MAKVVAPLLSLEARGKVGDALVFFPWKGRNSVRAWTKPSNPRDIDQKLIRQKFASLGKNVKVVKRVLATLPNGSKMYQLLKAVTPATQIWNAFMVKSALDDLKIDANFIELSDDLFGCADTLPEWRCAATELNMATLTGAPYATTISPELQLIMGAYAAYKLELSSYTDIYSTYPTNWETDVISGFQLDYQTVSA